MKNLKDILEKLKIDDIKLTGNFPIDGTIEEMAKFLEEEGFQHLASDIVTIPAANNAKAKCFMLDKTETELWFADTSKEKISRKNPIFSIEIYYKSIVFSTYSYNSRGFYERIIDNDKEEFLEELNKQFGW